MFHTENKKSMKSIVFCGCECATKKNLHSAKQTLAQSPAVKVVNSRTNHRPQARDGEFAEIIEATRQTTRHDRTTALLLFFNVQCFPLFFSPRIPSTPENNQRTCASFTSQMVNGRQGATQTA